MAKTESTAPKTVNARRNCPTCGKGACLTLWMPTKGMDHTLRQFYCEGDRLLFFVSIPTESTRVRLTNLQTDMITYLEKQKQEAKTASLALPGTVPATSQRSAGRARPDSGRSAQ